MCSLPNVKRPRQTNTHGLGRIAWPTAEVCVFGILKPQKPVQTRSIMIGAASRQAPHRLYCNSSDDGAVWRDSVRGSAAVASSSQASAILSRAWRCPGGPRSAISRHCSANFRKSVVDVTHSPDTWRPSLSRCRKPDIQKCACRDQVHRVQFVQATFLRRTSHTWVFRVRTAWHQSPQIHYACDKVVRRADNYSIYSHLDEGGLWWSCSLLSRENPRLCQIPYPSFMFDRQYETRHIGASPAWPPVGDSGVDGRKTNRTSACGQGRPMTTYQPRTPYTDAIKRPTCSKCGSVMRLFGIEPKNPALSYTPSYAPSASTSR